MWYHLIRFNENELYNYRKKMKQKRGKRDDSVQIIDPRTTDHHVK